MGMIVSSVSMIVSRFTSFASNFVIRSHQFFRSGLDCTSAFSARSPCNLGSQADIAISVIWEAALKVIHEKNWKRLGVLKHIHLPDRGCTPVATLADHATSFLVLPRCRHF